MTTPRTYGSLNYGDGTYGLGSTVGAPEIDVEVWGTNEDWVEITCDVRSIDIDRGRQQLLDSFRAGSLTVQVANFQDYYSPWNPNSIWSLSGQYQTDVPIRVCVTYPDNTEVMLFTGTTDSVNDSWPGAGVDAMVTIQATDGLKTLTRAAGLPLPAPVGAHELSGARVQRWLNVAQWWQATTISPGTVTLQATSLDGNVLQALQEVEFNEGGMLFVGVDGNLVFKDRNALENDDRMVTVQARFMDHHPTDTSSPWCCYNDIVPAVDETQVYNRVQLIRGAIAVPVTDPANPGVLDVPVWQVAQDTNSVNWFGPRALANSSTLIVDSDPQVLALAQLIVAEHADNEKRIDSITITPSPSHPDGSDIYWIAGNIRLTDRIQVERHMPGGTFLGQQLLVQGIHHAITPTGTRQPGSWVVTYSTTPALDIGSDWDADPGTPGSETDGWDVSTFSV